MRTQLLVALAFLCGAEVACAQQWPTSPSLPYAPAPSSAPWIGSYVPSTAPSEVPVLATSPPSISSAPLVEGGEVLSASSTRGRGGSNGICWVSADYLMGWVQSYRLPIPLVTTGSTADAIPGTLGVPGTQVLFGDEVTFGNFYGFQAALGAFCDDDRRFSIEGRGFVLFEDNIRFFLASDANGSPLIARPLYDVDAERPGVAYDAFPNVIAGNVDVQASTKLYGFEVNTRYHSMGTPRLRANALLGFRYLNLEEMLAIHDEFRPLRNNAVTFNGQPITQDDLVRSFDQFNTRNQFYGGQIGGQVYWEEPWFFLNFHAKIGFGCTQQQAVINGSSTLITPTGTETAVGGVLALASNIGGRTRNVFGILPECGISGGLFVTDYLRISAGYSILLWNRVLRPGDAIDPQVNTGLIPTSPNFGLPGPAKPEFRFNDSSFWVQSFQCGLEWTF